MWANDQGMTKWNTGDVRFICSNFQRTRSVDKPACVAYCKILEDGENVQLRKVKSVS